MIDKNKPSISQLDEQWLIRKTLTERFLEAGFEKHDNTQLEMILKYRENTKFKQSRQKYLVDFYFFFPASLKLVEKGYKARHFYFNLTNHLRLRSPDMLPSNFIDTENSEYPIGKLYELKRQMLENPQLDLCDEAIENFKFAANFLLNFFKTINIEECFPKDYCINDHFDIEIELCEILLDTFRKVVKRYREIFSNKYPELIEKIDYVDEYISYMLETNWSIFLQNSDSEDLKNKVREILNSEIEYRKNNQNIIPAENYSDTKKNFVYRLSLLKKFVQSQLYLDDKFVKVKNYLVQFIAMFAAGLAAALAAIVAYSLESFQSKPNPIFAVTPGILIIITSFIYILKDRIKDLIKLVLGKKVVPKFDTARKLYLPSNPKKSFADFKEFVNITEKSQIDEKILNIREHRFAQKLDSTKMEDVIHYSKKMNIDWKRLKLTSPTTLNELKEIFRFNLRDFLVGMDDPKQNFVAYDHKQHNSVNLEVEKIYHINVVLHITNTTGTEVDDDAFYRIRLIVDRKGIRSIQNIPLS